MTFDVLAQVVADVVQVERFFHGDGATGDLGFLDEHDGKALANDIAGRHCHGAHDAAMRGRDDVLHFHGFDDRDLLALPHFVAHGDGDRRNGALNRRGDTDRSVRAHQRGLGLWLRDGRLHLGIVREKRQRIAAFHARAGEAAVVGSSRRRETWLLVLAGDRQRRHVLIHPAGVNAAGREIGMRQYGAQEWNVGGDALDAELAQRARGTADRGGEIRRMDNDLGK